MSPPRLRIISAKDMIAELSRLIDRLLALRLFHLVGGSRRSDRAH